MNLTNGRPKIFFGPIDKETQAKIFSYAKELVKGIHPDAEFLEGDQVRAYKVKDAGERMRCLLVEDIFERDDFPVLINQAYGNGSLILIGISRLNQGAIDYGKMTLVGGRYETYRVYVHPFSDLPPEVGYISYLSKGERLFSATSYAEEALPRIGKTARARKDDDLGKLFSFIMENAGKPLSIREISRSFPLSLSPHTVGKYLDAYIDNFLLFRMEGFDLSKMRRTDGRFRLYPYDTSLYSFGPRETAMNVDLLSLSPLIGRLKEEGYECHYGYAYSRRLYPDGSRRYEFEDIGPYAEKDGRRLLFALNIGREKKFASSLVRLSPTIEKYVVEGGKGKKEYDDDGLCHVGIEYLLGEEGIQHTRAERFFEEFI